MSYLRPLAKHTLLLTILTVVLGILAVFAVATLANSAPYEAQAVVLFKPANGINLDQTAGTDPLNTLADATRPQQSIKVLMSTVDVATTVRDRAAASPDPDAKALAALSPLALRNAVAVDTKAGLIYVKAQAGTPEAATWLANAWAEAAILKINRIYATQAANVSVTQAVDTAKADLDKAEAALQTFMAANPPAVLTQTLKQSEAFLDAVTAMDTANRMTLYSAERAAARKQIDQYYGYLNNLDQQLNEIRALRTRVEQGGNDADALYANQITLLLALNRVVSGNPGPGTSSVTTTGDQTTVSSAAPVQVPQLQFQLSGDPGKAPRSRDAQLHDVDTLIAAVQKLQTDVRASLKTLQDQVNAPLPALTPGVGAMSPALVAQIEEQNRVKINIEQKMFQLTQLEKTRDLAQNTYDLLRTRQAEQAVNGVISSVVDVGTPAAREETRRAVSFSSALVLALGGLLLLIWGGGGALAWAAAQVRPDWDSNRALRRRFGRQAAGPPRPAPVAARPAPEGTDPTV